MSNTTHLVQNHVTDDGKAFRFVHTGADKLATQEEVSVVPLFLF